MRTATGRDVDLDLDFDELNDVWRDSMPSPEALLRLRLSAPSLSLRVRAHLSWLLVPAGGSGSTKLSAAPTPELLRSDLLRE